MYLFYSFEQIKSFACFVWVDFESFSYFQSVAFTLGVNLYFLIFLIFILNISYKIINRLLNIIF